MCFCKQAECTELFVMLRDTSDHVAKAEEGGGICPHWVAGRKRVTWHLIPQNLLAQTDTLMVPWCLRPCSCYVPVLPEPVAHPDEWI